MSISAQPLSSRMPRTRPSVGERELARRVGPAGGEVRQERRRGALGRRHERVLRGAPPGDEPQRGAVACAPRRRFAKARTGSSKNITPKREMIMSKLAGSNAWVLRVGADEASPACLRVRRGRGRRRSSAPRCRRRCSGRRRRAAARPRASCCPRRSRRRARRRWRRCAPQASTSSGFERLVHRSVSACASTQWRVRRRARCCGSLA